MNRSYRVQLALVGLLAVQCLLIVVLRSPFTAAHAPSAARSLLPGLESSAAQRIALEGSDGAVTLARDGEKWSIEELGGYPADGVKVNDLLTSLTELKVREPVVTSSRHHDSLGITDDENEGRVRVYTGGEDAPAVDLILGSAPNYRVMHLRQAADDEVYEVRGLASYDVRPDTAAWADKNLVDLEATAVTALSFSNLHGSVELTKAESGWALVGGDGTRALDSAKIDELISSLTALRLAEPAPANDGAFGLDPPVASATLTVDGDSGPRVIVVHVGSPVAGNDSQRYVTRDGFGFAGIIWESSVKALLDRKLEDLVIS
jgi:hypothetical protein